MDDIIERSKGPCVQAMKDAGFTAANIDEAILVGGSTRIPKVQELVKTCSAKSPTRALTR